MAVFSEKFSVDKLHVHIPKPLEVVWALLKPKDPAALIRKVILCSFYSPPNSKKNKLLLDHIINTYNCLKTKHPEASIIMSGDKNNLDETIILAMNSDLRQIVDCKQLISETSSTSQ